jgi:hypothetical protein
MTMTWFCIIAPVVLVGLGMAYSACWAKDNADACKPEGRK